MNALTLMLKRAPIKWEKIVDRMPEKERGE